MYDKKIKDLTEEEKEELPEIMKSILNLVDQELPLAYMLASSVLGQQAYAVSMQLAEALSDVQRLTVISGDPKLIERHKYLREVARSLVSFSQEIHTEIREEK